MLGGPLERSGFPPPAGSFTPPRCGLFLLRRSQLGDDLGDAPEELGPDQEVAFERRLERDPGLLAESVDAGHAPSGRSDLALLQQVHVVSLRRSAVVAGRGLVRIFYRPFLLLFAAGGRSSRSGAQRSRDAGRRSPINGGADAGWCLSVQDQHSEQVSAGCSCGSAGPLRQSFRLCMVIGTTTGYFDTNSPDCLSLGVDPAGRSRKRPSDRSRNTSCLQACRSWRQPVGSISVSDSGRGAGGEEAAGGRGADVPEQAASYYGQYQQPAPVGLLADLRRLLTGPSARARATPAARTQASQAGSVSDRVSDAVPAAARSTRAQTESPEPPPERPGSAREAAGVKNKARGISRN